jgi:hypothetical protein
MFGDELLATRESVTTAHMKIMADRRLRAQNTSRPLENKSSAPRAVGEFAYLAGKSEFGQKHLRGGNRMRPKGNGLGVYRLHRAAKKSRV